MPTNIHSRPSPARAPGTTLGNHNKKSSSAKPHARRARTSTYATIENKSGATIAETIAIVNVLNSACWKGGEFSVRCQFASVQGRVKLKKPKRVMKLPAITESNGTTTSQPVMLATSANTGQRQRPRSISAACMRPVIVV